MDWSTRAAEYSTIGLFLFYIYITVWPVIKERSSSVAPDVKQRIKNRLRSLIPSLVLVCMAVSISYLYYAKGAEIAKLKEENSQLKQQISLYSASDIIPPAVWITTPSNRATVSGTIIVSATASDNVFVASVQFKLDGANLGREFTAAPYTLSWATATVTNGAHTLTAVARDAAGNIATSGAASVMVVNGGLFTQ